MDRPENDPRHDPEEGRPIGPREECLEPGEIDLTGATRQDANLADVIGDAIYEAQQRDEEVPDWGARAIARYLANHQGSFASALHQFAATGDADLQRAASELAELWTDRTLPVRARDWINWLGTYLVRLINDGPEVDASPAIRAAVAGHGAAFVAFLRLPDVTEDNAIELFQNCYVGVYASLEDMAEDVRDTLGTEALEELGALDSEGALDRAQLLRLTRDVWDIVEIAGRYYLFEK